MDGEEGESEPRFGSRLGAANGQCPHSYGSVWTLTVLCEGREGVQEVSAIDREVSVVRPLAEWSLFGQFGRCGQARTGGLTAAEKRCVLDNIRDCW